MATAAVRRYWNRVAALGCLCCGGEAEIAHAHGGSIVERMQEPKAKGKKLARYDWLVLPLCPYHHRWGPGMSGFLGSALDDDVRQWEAQHGSQAEHIDRLCVKFGMDLWTLAGMRQVA